MELRPVSEDASRDAWLYLMYTLGPLPRRSKSKSSGAAGTSTKGTTLHQNTCGHGFDVEGHVHLSEQMKHRLGISAVRKSTGPVTTLGASPMERRLASAKAYIKLGRK
jgi:hypothetical protein